MPIFRLLSFALLIAALAASGAAQTSPEKSLPVVQSRHSGQPNSSDGMVLLSPNLNPALSPEGALDRIHVNEFRPRLSQFGLSHILHVSPERPSQGDTYCYAMRSYKVARDNPQSDSVHAAGYSTCQPSARFQVYTIEERDPPSAP